MTNNTQLVIQSRHIFVFLAFGCVLYVMVLFAEVDELLTGDVVVLIYAMLGVPLIYTTWQSMDVIIINKDDIYLKRSLGFGKSIRFKINDIRQLYVRPDHYGQPSRVIIIFSSGQRIQLHKYQRNFLQAMRWLENELQDITAR